MASTKRQKSKPVDPNAPIVNHPWDISVAKRILRSTIKNAPYNPRRMPEKAKKRLEAGMAALKLLGPLNWNERSGNLIGGHQRIAILDLHADGAPDYYLQVAAVDLSDADEVAANLLLNNPEAQADWDPEKLVEAFKFEGLNIEATGFTAAEMYEIGGDDAFTEHTVGEVEKLAEKLRSERQKHANIVKGNKDRDNKDYYIVIVFPDSVKCTEFMQRHGLVDNRGFSFTFQPWEEFEKRMPVEESDEPEFGELPTT